MNKMITQCIIVLYSNLYSKINKNYVTKKVIKKIL